MTSNVFTRTLSVSDRPMLGDVTCAHNTLSANNAPGARITARNWHEIDRPDRIGQWRALAQWAAEPNPFYEDWFLLPSLRAFDPDAEVQILCLEVNGQLAGLMPIVRKNSYYGYPIPHYATWLHANCFLGLPLIATGFEHLFWEQALKWCDEQGGLVPSLFLHLSHMPENGAIKQALTHVLERSDRPAATVKSESRAMLSSDMSPEDYLAGSLSSKKRKELRRQSRRLEEEGTLTFERLSNEHGLCEQEVGEWADAFTALEQKGWKGRAGSALGSGTDTQQFFKQALIGAAKARKLERLCLSLDGRPIAMLANFLCAPGAFSFKTAFDEDYSRFSPGVLLQRENLDILTHEDVEWMDSCAAQDHPMIDHIWRERRVINRYSIAIGGKLRRAVFSGLIRKETGKNPGPLS